MEEERRYCLPPQGKPLSSSQFKKNLAALRALRSLCTDDTCYLPSGGHTSSHSSFCARRKLKSTTFSYKDFNKPECISFIKSLMTDASTRKRFKADYADLSQQLPSGSCTKQPPPPQRWRGGKSCPCVCTGWKPQDAFACPG